MDFARKGLCSNRTDGYDFEHKAYIYFNENDIDEVKRQLPFLVDEPAFIHIIQDLAEKNNMTFFCAALWAQCTFMGIQDAFDIGIGINLPDLVKTKIFVQPYLDSNEDVQEIYEERLEKLLYVLEKRKFREYRGVIDSLRNMVYFPLRYFNVINRSRLIGFRIRSKFIKNKKFNNFVKYY